MHRLVRLAVAFIVAALAGTGFVAAPSALAAGPTGVLATAKPWHYWISFVLVASLVGLVAAIAFGYVWRVVLVKYGFRTEK